MKKKSFLIFKRILDLLFALPLSVILLPVFLVIGIVIAAESRGCIFFTQIRLGKHRRRFRIYKFRTMKATAPAGLPARTDIDRECYVTRVGAFLRRTGLDELPQIFNIIRGEMSFIGPRPVIETEADLHDLRDTLGVYNVLPGITGWAQVNGRNIASISDKARFDGEYIDRMSPAFDLKIFFMTVGAIFSGKKFEEIISE